MDKKIIKKIEKKISEFEGQGKLGKFIYKSKCGTIKIKDIKEIEDKYKVIYNIKCNLWHPLSWYMAMLLFTISSWEEGIKEALQETPTIFSGEYWGENTKFLLKRDVK